MAVSSHAAFSDVCLQNFQSTVANVSFDSFKSFDVDKRRCDVLCSCAPNAINYVLNGDTMVVRAATDVKAGDEVTISYMGRPQLVRGKSIQWIDDHGQEVRDQG